MRRQRKRPWSQANWCLCRARSARTPFVAQNSTAASGALIDVMGTDDPYATRIARLALTRLAHRWTDEDFAALNASQRARLRGLVVGLLSVHNGYGAAGPEKFPAERAALRIALCQTFGRMGNADDLRALRREAGSRAWSKYGIEVRQAAREAVPLLEARLAEQNRPQMLLRASAPPPALGAQLLRAAASVSPTGSDQLLRAAEVSESPNRSSREGGDSDPSGV